MLKKTTAFNIVVRIKIISDVEDSKSQFIIQHFQVNLNFLLYHYNISIADTERIMQKHIYKLLLLFFYIQEQNKNTTFDELQLVTLFLLSLLIIKAPANKEKHKHK